MVENDSTTDATTQGNYYLHPCPYKARCTSYPLKCDDCAHGYSDYFQPKPGPVFPWYPYPYRPSEPIWFGKSGTWFEGNSDTTIQ